MSTETYYPDYTSDNFSDVLNKYEFAVNASDNKKSFVYQDPSQLLLRNYISKPTIYDSVLLFNEVGTGKSCAAISIAEGFKEYVNNVGRRIVVLVKNKNIHRNFINELLSGCTGNEYLTNEQRDVYFGINTGFTDATTQIEKEKYNRLRQELVNKVHRTINKSYHFITYGAFVNQVLGMKIKSLKTKTQPLSRKPPQNPLKHLSNTVIIVDEAHNVTNNDVYIALQKVLSNSFNYRLVLLTATPMYDNPKEIFEISNLLNANNASMQLPIRKELFKTDGDKQFMVRANSKLINGNILKGGILSVTESGLDALKHTLFGKVSYLKANTITTPSTQDTGQELIPNRIGTSNVVFCEMSDQQYQTYINAVKMDVRDFSMYDMSNSIANIEAGDNAQSNTTSKSGSLYKNSSDASTMVYPTKTGMAFGKNGYNLLFEEKIYKSALTTDLHMYSCKLHKMLQNLDASPGNAFIYSNFVSFGGTTLIKQVLLANGYKEYQGKSTNKTFVMFDESTNVETRERYRRVFNSPANKDGAHINIIVGSPIISEGVTLKNVRQVHILEPSWNMSRIHQIVGRAVRNMSHQDLDAANRNVDIFKYVAVYNGSTGNELFARFFIDKEKYILSEEKDRANKKVERLLKELSFDCQLMKERNAPNNLKTGTAACDYQPCDYKCLITSDKSKHVDKSTYNMHISFFDKFDIAFIMNTLRDMYKKHFVWSLDDITNTILHLDPHVSHEAIYATIGYIIETKVPFQDAYNRDGFIIHRGDYYIFNGSDVDVNGSMFQKTLDFSVDRNKFTLEDYVKNTLGKSIFSEETKAIKKKKKTVKDVVLTATDIKYNNKIINDHKVFGTYRQRGIKDNPFGPKDDKFRIVDSRHDKKNTKVNDQRKNITGMWIGSYKKPQLLDIVKYLGIKTTAKDKSALAQIIENELVKLKRVLK